MGILNPKRKEKKPPKEAPKWFMIMMVGFVLYAIINSIFSDKVDRIKEQSHKAGQNEKPQFLFSQLEGKRALPLFTRDRKVGTGPIAGCWETVFANYRLYNDKGELIEEKMDSADPVRFEIGRGTETLALERGILGMQRGGRREVTARPEMAYNASHAIHPKLTDKDSIAYDVKLLDITHPENLPVSNFGLRFYDDRTGKGQIAQCTDTVQIRLRGWKIEGSSLWPEHDPAKLVTIAIGRGEAPYAIEKALIGMQSEGKRTVIIPPGYGAPIFMEEAKKSAFTPWEELPIPQNEAILLELELVAFVKAKSGSEKSIDKQPVKE